MKRFQWRMTRLLLALMLLLMSLPATSATLTSDKADVRVLIDISGSMKQNDPQNLRRPALRLLVGLLPKDTRAGVWTFGQYVNMQIPLGQVDAAWKRKARASSKGIGSPGQYTNIADALTRATEDWNGPPTKFRRSVVLLTDGMVDISKSKAKNRESRQRILEKILPRLRELGVAVHTIALSKNADHGLMQKLAETSGGWYEQVESADQLQKVFLRIFEKVGKPDAVPMKDNKFTIDDSITEATVLVFRKPGADPTQVIPPGGKPFGAENVPKSISWHRDEGYDMLTISDPQSGEWRVRAKVDPDNRVMVVTDLKMQTSELSNRLIHGQSMPFEVSFTDHGKQIRKEAFLKVVNVAATRFDAAGETEPSPLLDDGRDSDAKPGDGVFSMQFGGEDLETGQGELVINASGRTFIREKRITFEVVPPVNLEVIPGEQPGQLNVAITPDDRLVDIPSLQTLVWLEDHEGEQFPLELRLTAEGSSQGELDIMSFTGSRKIFVKSTGRTQSGSPLSYLDSPVEVEGLMPAPLEKPEIPAPVPIEAEPEAKSPDTEAELKQEPLPEPIEEDDWVMTAVWIGVANLLLLLAAGGIFWWMRRQNQLSLVTLMDEKSQAEEPLEEVKAA